MLEVETIGVVKHRGPTPIVRDADVALRLGIVSMKLLEIPQAMCSLEEAVRLAPESFYPRLRLAELYMRVGVPTRAKEEIERAMELSETPEQRAMARKLLAVDAERSARRAWRP